MLNFRAFPLIPTLKIVLLLNPYDSRADAKVATLVRARASHMLKPRSILCAVSAQHAAVRL